MKNILSFLLLLAFSIIIGKVSAADYYVDGNNGSNTTGDGSQTKPWKSITFALTQVTASTELHTIHVAAAVYDTSLETFPITMKNKVSLIGAGRDVTILDAKGMETVIRCENILDQRTRIDGFSIINGQGQYIAGEPTAGGIQLVTSSPIIINNMIEENKDSDNRKTGIRCINQSSPVIENNLFNENEIEIGLSWQPSNPSNVIIRNNLLDGCGIKIVCKGSPLIEGNTIRGSSTYAISCESTSGTSPLITKNVITENKSSIAINCQYSSPKIEKNIISNNSGIAILFEYFFGTPTGPTIVNNTIDGNEGDAIVCETNFDYSAFIPLIKNNIISNNLGYGIKESAATTEIQSAQFNLFFNNTDGHYLDAGTQPYTNITLMDSLLQECQWNLEGDPMFVDAVNNNYHLKPGSPANNAGDPSSPLDGDGTRADIGALPLFDWTGPPNTPRNLRAIPGHSEISLLWSPNPDEDLAYYTVYRSQTDGFIPSANDSIDKINTPDTIYDNEGLRNGITFFYRICAVDSTGQKSGFTSQVSATPTFNPDFLLVTAPTDKIFVNKTPVLVKGIAVTPDIKKLEINGTQVPIVNDSFELSVNLTEGTNTIGVVGFDSLNTVAKEINLTIKLDATLPLVRITSPGSQRSFSYSPIKVQGTVTENNLVSVDVNGIKAKCTNNNFVLGENQDEGFEIEEGWYWIKAIAVDSAGNIRTDSVQVNGVPPSPLKLYLKNDKLSWFPFPPYPSNTTEGYSTSFVFDQNTWGIPLKGDIQGSTYSFSLLVGCFGLGSATMIADLILKHNNDELILASTPSFSGSMAGWTPFGYWGPSKKEFTIEGIDPNSTIGDTLILKVRKTDGDRVGLIFIHELDDGHSCIKIPSIVTHVVDQPINDFLPTEFNLYQNYPNPFSSVTTIPYSITKRSNVIIKIYNAFGRDVAILVNEEKSTGNYSIEFNASYLSSGFYYYQIEVDEFISTKKMVLLR